MLIIFVIWRVKIFQRVYGFFILKKINREGGITQNKINREKREGGANNKVTANEYFQLTAVQYSHIFRLYQSFVMYNLLQISNTRILRNKSR